MFNINKIRKRNITFGERVTGTTVKTYMETSLTGMYVYHSLVYIPRNKNTLSGKDCGGSLQRGY